jgi:hypothetical protein
MSINNLLIHGSRAYGWLIGGARVPGLSPQALAYWESMQRCSAAGLDFDVGGAPREGVRHLKQRLGAEWEDASAAVLVRPRFLAPLGELWQRAAARRQLAG